MGGNDILLTGGNSVIGKRAARSLAKMGADLTLVCRDQTRGESAAREMALNYSAPFFLANLPLDMLENGAASTIVNVSSTDHYSGRLDLEGINGGGNMWTGGVGAYARSKLAHVLFTYELARRLQGKGETVNCLHPGAVRTHIWAQAASFSPPARFASLFMLSPEDGAETSVFLASSPEVEVVTGTYFEKSKPKRPSEASCHEALAARLWDPSMKTTGLR
jgi:NAD(P)-dependent dehydrogenase (short-subunit alcohol dehydrogenase family)